MLPIQTIRFFKAGDIAVDVSEDLAIGNDGKKGSAIETPAA